MLDDVVGDFHEALGSGDVSGVQKLLTSVVRRCRLKPDETRVESALVL